MNTKKHWSDCALHREPAYPAGPCNCGGITLGSKLWVYLYRLIYNLALAFGLFRLKFVRKLFHLA